MVVPGASFGGVVLVVRLHLSVCEAAEGLPEIVAEASGDQVVDYRIH